MRILYFYQYFTTPKGAWSTRAYEFARRWVERGHQVTLVTSIYEASDLSPEQGGRRLEVDGIDLVILDVRLSHEHGFLRRIGTFLAYALRSSWYALREPADVVLASSGPITVGVPALVARWLRRRPLVFEVRDLWPEGAIQLGVLRNRMLIRLARALETACYRSARRVVALSPGQAEDILARHHGTPVEVVPNASDNELAERVEAIDPLPDWARGRRLFTYAGTLGLIDDCSQIVALATELARRRRDDLKVVVIGTGRERSRLEAAASDLENIHFLGRRSREEVFAWLEASRAALFTVKSVPFLATASPNKLFDAFAAGLPVIQTTTGWIRELLAAERCGLTVAENDAAAFADAVERLADDAGLWREMSAQARRLAVERFDRGLLAESLLEHLAAAAADGVDAPTRPSEPAEGAAASEASGAPGGSARRPRTIEGDGRS